MYERKPRPQGFLTEDIDFFIRFRQARLKWCQSSEINLRLFEKHCYACENGKHDSLNQEMIDSWFKQRPTETPSSCYKRNYIVSYFLQFLRDRGKTTLTIPPLPKNTHTRFEPHNFTQEELQAIFWQLDHMSRKYRHKKTYYRWLTAPVFFRLLYVSGMRPVEIRNLKRKNVNLQDGVISIEVTKGRNYRYIAVGQDMLDLLKVFDSKMNQLEPDRVYFFPSPEGRPYSNQWVTQNFKEACRKAGITDCRVYDLRHHYAIYNINRWINQGALADNKLVYLSLSMGHASLNETKYYYHYVPELAEIVNDIEESGLEDIIPEADDGWKEDE